MILIGFQLLLIDQYVTSEGLLPRDLGPPVGDVDPTLRSCRHTRNVFVRWLASDHQHRFVSQRGTTLLLRLGGPRPARPVGP